MKEIKTKPQEEDIWDEIGQEIYGDESFLWNKSSLEWFTSRYEIIRLNKEQVSTGATQGTIIKEQYPGNQKINNDKAR